MNYYNPYGPYPTPAAEPLQQMRQPQFPQYQPPQMNQPQQSGMVWVKSRQEAENYPVAPYTAIALWDESGPYVHGKETDISGRANVRTFKLEEVTAVPQEPKAPALEYVTRKEFEELTRRVSSVLKEKEGVSDESVS